jgi:hypothetical protein
VCNELALRPSPTVPPKGLSLPALCLQQQQRVYS